MGIMVVLEKPYTIGYAQYEEHVIESNELRIEMIYSGISAGTQLTLYRGKNPYINKRFDHQLRLFDEQKEGKTPFPIPGAWAYEEVGRVCELGKDVRNVKLGDIVYGTWGHRSTTIVNEEYALEHMLPENVNPVIGIYSQMGVIALNAILDADIHVGETVAVFGQGVPGQMVSQLARLNGAKVIAVDLDDFRLEMSAKLGADIVINSGKCDAAREIKKLTNGGADKVIEITGSGPALNEAVRACIYQGRVVCAGFIAGEAKGLYLGEEFHHNRIQIVCSQVENVGLSLSNAWDRRRMEKTIVQLFMENKLDLLSLITHTMPFDESAKAYDMLDKSTECLQVVLKFDKQE